MIIIFLLFLTIYPFFAIQLCDPLTAPYPCSACQPYAELNSGLCQCPDGFYMNTDHGDQFCDKCHTSCLTCSGSRSTDCKTCRSKFVFSNADSTCTAPDSDNDEVLVEAYEHFGFSKKSGWTVSSFSAETFHCGTTTLLGGVVTSYASDYLQVSISSIPTHFQLRIIVAYYFLNSNNTAKSATVDVDGSVKNFSGEDEAVTGHSCSGYTYAYRNIDSSFTHSSSSATIKFRTNANVYYGIREVYVIAKKCHSDCASCDGYESTQCLTCTDSTRRATYTSINNGTCLCEDNYYEEPYSGNCVDPCPSVPTKYYGDNETRDCVEVCPDGSFASDDYYRCWADCPTTSPKNSKKLFRDYTNKKCVANCPSTEPYGYEDDRKCYSTCPGSSYKSDATEMRCVNVCPHDSTHRTYGYNVSANNGSCVAHCPDGYWADSTTATCVQTCPSSIPYHDNSTGDNVCVATCPAPNRFADLDTDMCVETCPSGKYGDDTRTCVTKCGSPLWGLISGNRKCVDDCPSGTWAEPVDRICVDTTDDCNPKYANDYTRECVVAGSCPFGTFADNSTYDCVEYCPDNSYGHPTTRYCQAECPSPYFRDDGMNLCVSTCVTENTYADVYSTRTCVTACNSSGSTPWADDSTKTCVSDCNQTVAAYLADNTTWKCVYNCPSPYVADYTTSAPKCVTVCPTNYFADFSSGTGVCVTKCSKNPPQFGDDNGGLNLCVDICTAGTYGDQTGNRLCVATCPGIYFSQNDDLRRCVTVCNDTSFGWNNICEEDPHDCPSNYFGDQSTHLCVNLCPASEVTFGDSLSNLCVRECPDNPNAGSGQPDTYYADQSNRLCVLTCNGSHSTPLFGNNDTRTCVPKCLDHNSYAEVQTTYRICVARCLQDPTRYYANNFSKVCGVSTSCPTTYYGENDTQICVEECPNSTFGFKHSTTRVCVSECPEPTIGDLTTGKPVCVTICPTVPEMFADLNERLCVSECPSGYYGNPVDRTCVNHCPNNYYSYQPTRRCIQVCPLTYYGDDTSNVRKCHPSSSDCTYGFGDDYLTKCVYTCSGPSPVNTFGSGDDCVDFCPNGTYADSHTGTRLCVALCPPGVTSSTASPDLYGDPTTHTCVDRCITPYTWADYQTRLCEEVCSANPVPTYSQNVDMTCVTALNCPNSPMMTFGDNNTRSCVSFCDSDEWGDPTSRNCVSQCPDPGTSRYYGDNSTGQRLCVIICPETPRLFGQNNTNQCVDECPIPTYGDQTGNRSCVPKCPLIGAEYHFAQNQSRICVKVCQNDTWGLQSSRECVEDPFHCGSLWADNSTHLCVATCPQTVGTFGDPTTKTCVPVCPDGSYADDLTRTCVTACPEDSGHGHDTFANNDTNICEEVCQQDGAFADPQTGNRYCVLECSQSPEEAFADSSTKECVPQCPTHPDLYGETQNFTCVEACVSPYFADTNTRRCQTSCPSSHFKLLDPRKCVTQCPSDPSLFGDTNTGFCEEVCSSGYRYSISRLCVASCQTYSLFEYNGSCIKYCPSGYYANSSGHCLSQCPSSTYGQNTTTTCQATCITGYADGSLCKAICPDGKYGQNKVCVGSCSGGRKASNISNLCVSTCDAGTFEENSVCETTCSSGNYADPSTHLCSSSCSNSRYADPSTNTCVQTCPQNSFRDPSFVCKTACAPLRADNLTGTCTSQCSDGLWGYDNQCIEICPDNTFGYETDRDCYDIANRPATNLFADNVTQTWVTVCPYEPLTYGDRTKKQCVDICTGTNDYADPITRECETSCSNTSYFEDPTTKICVLTCPEGYHANPSNNICQKNCTHSLYDYEPERRCVSSCPAPYYGYDNATQKICLLGCPDGYYAEGDRCQTGCTLPRFADSKTNRCVYSCIDSYASDDSIACEDTCSQHGTIADNSTNTCVDLCPTDPDYYEEDGFCVMHCSGGKFADPTSGLRECVTTCTEGLYGEPLSGRCLAACLPGYYAENDTNLCVEECPSGFADNSSGYCVATCPSPTFADSLNNKCSKICSGSQFGQGRVCVSVCTDPNYGNPLTRQCEVSCPSFDYLFAQNTTNMCVKNCSIVANSYGDRNNNVCVSNCTRSNQYMLDGEGICTSLCPEGLFMENSTKKCQSSCTTGYAEPTSRYCVAKCFGNPQTFAHIPSKTCIYKCLTDILTLYADNSTYQCVSTCPTSPNYFSDPISGNCVLFCPEGLYSETGSRTCTDYCSVGFADNYTRKCVSQCPSSEDTYADPTTRTCVKVCPDGLYAENDTQTCVDENSCPTNTWSDIKSKHCVSRCPSEPLYFGYNATTNCVQQCPLSPELYGDYVSQTCITSCTSVGGELRFADPLSRTCVFVCPITEGLYGDTLTGKCVTSCSGSQLKDNSTQRCVSVCPSNPDYYALTSSSTCVRVCPDNLYASDPTSRVCVSGCSAYSTFADPTTNRCAATCPQPYFADDSTYKCVLSCPSSEGYYADPHTRTCVSTCPWGSEWRSFAEDTDRTCVTRCPDNEYAQNSTRECVSQCPSNQYADTIIQVCVADCSVRPGQYKETTDRVCVTDCPSSPTKYHKYAVNHTCVSMVSAVKSGCPGSYFANPENDMCTTKCPHGYYAETATKMCVTGCGSGEFADEYDRTCTTNCNSNPESFAYTIDRTCEKYCPSPYFSENQTWTCVTDCPSSPQVYYAYQPTRQCVIDCPEPYYSYLPDQTCILQCPDNYYAQDSTRSCQTTCASPFNADSSTNRCVQICPQDPELYAHNNVCESSCPDPYFKDISTRTCVTECPVMPLLFADDSTNTCVEDCPSTPNYFADNVTRKCVTTCHKNSTYATFAQTTTRTCVLDCPTQESTYADPSTGACQSSCPSPYYRSNLTHECVTQCPNLPFKTYAQDNGRVCVYVCEDGTFGDNDTKACVSDCMTVTDGFADTTTNVCVTTCPVGWFAYNATKQCRRDCPGGLFADSSTRKCVTACPGTERLFADQTTYQCVSQCPSGLYGNTQNWTCIDACSSTTNGYRLQVARLCVQQCPAPYFAFVSTRICVTNCGAGLYGDPVTRECKSCPSTCPTCLAYDNCLTCDSGLYLSYGSCVSECILSDAVANYADDATMHCVIATKCASGTFGSNATKECVSACPAQMYGNSTTKTCENCPSTCLSCSNSTYCSSCVSEAQYASSDSYCYGHCNSTHQYSVDGECYESCPAGTYVDYTNVNCEACNGLCLTCEGNSLNCTSCDGTFKYNHTCTHKCPDSYYAHNEECFECSPEIESCSEPLTFQTESVTENYRTVVVVKFNKKVNVKGKPKNFVKIKLKVKRRLATEMSDLINDGVDYDAVVLPDGTIKLYLNPGMSVQNSEYQVVFTDGQYITTDGGATLQNLESSIQLQEADYYPEGTTDDAPLVPVATGLSIALLVGVFFMLIFGLSPFYIAIESFQIFSLYAYTENIAPNLFYFLKQLRLTRFAFMPNLFNGVFVDPESYDNRIPQKVLDTEGQLSFSVNATGFVFFVFFYILYAFIIFIFTTKLNSNRPLKNLFIKIFQTRIKFGIFNDFLWLFTLNILACGFMQFRYTDNGGDLAMSIIFSLVVLVMIFGLFGFGIHKFRSDPSQIEDNYSELSEGTKDEWQNKFFTFAYYFRKIIFAVVIVAAVFEPMVQVSILCAMFSIYLIVVVAFRPYQDNLRNFIHFAHEGGLVFINGGIIFFLQMVAANQPVGSKIVNGEIISIVLIIHLSIAILWGIFRSYMHLKMIKDEFVKTQFYKLYLDDQYDESIEKELSELNQGDKGEVESVEIAQTDVGNEEEEIIKLKIKRKVKKTRPKVEKEEMIEEGKANKRKKDKYIKVSSENEKYYELKPHGRKAIEEQYEQMVIENQPVEKGYGHIQEEKKEENGWSKMVKDEDKDSEDDEINKKIDDFERIEEDKLEKKKNDMMKSNMSSFKDFDERNFFKEDQPQKEQESHKSQSQKEDQVKSEQFKENDEVKSDEAKSQVKEEEDKNQNLDQSMKKEEPNQEKEEKKEEERKEKREDIYDAFDFNDILGSDKEEEKVQDKKELKIEDMEESENEEDKKKKEEKRKLHLLLFDDDDDD